MSYASWSFCPECLGAGTTGRICSVCGTEIAETYQRLTRMRVRQIRDEAAEVRAANQFNEYFRSKREQAGLPQESEKIVPREKLAGPYYFCDHCGYYARGLGPCSSCSAIIRGVYTGLTERQMFQLLHEWEQFEFIREHGDTPEIVQLADRMFENNEGYRDKTITLAQWHSTKHQIDLDFNAYQTAKLRAKRSLNPEPAADNGSTQPHLLEPNPNPSNQSGISGAVFGGLLGGLFYFAIAFAAKAVIGFGTFWIAPIGVALAIVAAPKIRNAGIVVPVAVLVVIVLAGIVGNSS